jgi:uncharacterized protein (TIGR00645 family)
MGRNASVLKIKLAMAIIGISSIHLLRTFIEAGNVGAVDGTRYTVTGIIRQTALGIAFIDRIAQPPVPEKPPA